MIDIENIVNPEIASAVSVLNRVAKRRKLGVKRWDNVLDIYRNSGTVAIPIELNNKKFLEPFYFVFEKLHDQEFLFTRPLKGEQWSLGTVYGFFGLYAFNNYTLGDPIILVEGVADWAVLKRYYKYVLCVNGAKISPLQMFLLSNLTKNVWAAYDRDSAGNRAYDRASYFLPQLGVHVERLAPPKKDWGALWEDEWGRQLLNTVMESFLSNILHYD